MNFLHSEIGSAKDNLKSPIHNWYKFTAGFSHKFVDEVITLDQLSKDVNSLIFDPFAGCGTTLVASQKAGVNAVGNESQEFMYKIIKAKLQWSLDEREINKYLIRFEDSANSEYLVFENIHPLIKSLYTDDTINDIYTLKTLISGIDSSIYQDFFNLALSQTLHKVSINPIAVPYIVRSKVLKNTDKAVKVFSSISRSMLSDLSNYNHINNTSKIYLQDYECSTCITSPPYLNNLDYGEISKVHTHFFGFTNNWNDITKNVRTNLVTGSTTHYKDKDFDLDNFLNHDFAISNPDVIHELIPIYSELKNICKTRGGNKSFDILMLLYFKDMYMVLKEIRRVLKKNGKAYLILGDSAPYGMFIPTTILLGKIALSLGFSEYKIHKIRSRGKKWQTLKHRHNLELSENVLFLK